MHHRTLSKQNLGYAFYWNFQKSAHRWRERRGREGAEQIRVTSVLTEPLNALRSNSHETPCACLPSSLVQPEWNLWMCAPDPIFPQFPFGSDNDTSRQSIA